LSRKAHSRRKRHYWSKELAILRIYARSMFPSRRAVKLACRTIKLDLLSSLKSSRVNMRDRLKRSRVNGTKLEKLLGSYQKDSMLNR
jgi:hypothetical protein